MHCISCTLKRKVEKHLLFKQTLKSRSTCLACQHFSFDANKSIDREMGFAGSLSFFVPLPSRAISHARGHLRVSRFARRTTEKKKKETAHSLTADGTVSSSDNANNASSRNPPTMREVRDTPITNNQGGTNIPTQ